MDPIANAHLMMAGTMFLVSQRWSGRYMRRFGAVLAMACAIAPLRPAHAQGATGNDELAAQATDPTASLMSFQLQDWYTANFHGLDDSLNQVVFRAAIPFALGDTRHIFRVTQPYVTSSPSGATGFADTTIFDLVVFNQPWGRWGVGISGTVPTGRSLLTADQWTAGPALGFAQSRRELRAGRDLRRPQVAPEHRGRLRPQERLWQSEVDVPGEHRAAAAHPLR